MYADLIGNYENIGIKSPMDNKLQISAKGRVQAQEMLQLNEVGINGFQILADKMHKTTSEIMKMSEDGLIPAQQAIEMLLEGMGEKFPNMMDKMSKSFVGLMSTLKDNVQMTMGKLLEGIFEGTKKKLQGLIAITQRFSDTFQYSLDQQAKQKTSNISSPTGTGGGPQGPSTMGAMDFAFTDILSGMGGDDAVQVWYDLKQAVSDTMQSIQSIVQTSMPSVNSVIEDTSSNILPMFGSAWDYICNTIMPLVNDAFMWISTNVLPPLSEGFSWFCENILPPLIDIFNSIWETVVSVFTSIFDTITTILGGLSEAFGIAWPTISEIVVIAVEMIAQLIDTLGQTCSGFAEFIAGVFAGDWARAWEGIKQNFMGVWNTILVFGADAVNALVKLINTAIGGINSAMGTSFGTLKEVSAPKVSKSVGEALGKTTKTTKYKGTQFKRPNLKAGAVDYSKPKGSLFSKKADPLTGKEKKAKKKKSDAEKAAEKAAKEALKRQEQYMDDYIKKIYSAAKAIMDFGGMFDKVISKKFSGEKFIKAMKSQLDVLKEWKANMEALGKKLGTKSSMYNTLLQMGPQAAGEIKAINQMQPDKLKEYASYFGEKEKLSYGIANMQTYSQGLQDTAKNNIMINITGNTIRDEYDVNKIASDITKKLKVAGVY